MSYQEYAPHPMLKDYIKCLWVMERDFHPLNGVIDVLPDSYSEIIFNIGSPCQVDDGQVTWELPASYLVTLLDKPFRLRAQGVVKTFGIRFFAWGLFPLMGINPQAAIHPLGDEWQVLSTQIASLQTEAAIDLIQQQFIPYVQAVKSHEQAVQHSSQLLFDQKGSPRIDDLARQCHLSRRQLERRFRDEVQVSPKTLALRIRFEQVRDQLCRSPEVDLARLAVDYGYADQAHLSRAFKAFTNRTPRQFIAEIRAVHEDLRYGVAFPRS